jgi:hypothetical protein
MPGYPTPRNGETMKKVPSKHTKVSEKRVTSPGADEMRPHYDFDYEKARPNRFAGRFKEETVAVILDADVADVFSSSESVNAFLRAGIRAMRATAPKPAKTPAKRRAS